MAKEARYWDKLDGQAVKCRLCPHGCLLEPGETGLCRARTNRDGVLESRNYGCVSSMALDPVEKKPLFHVEPGALLLSAGSFGCNFRCEFCQNWQISQAEAPCHVLSPVELVDLAVQSRKSHSNAIGIAYTYNEPGIWYEFVRECSEAAKEESLRNVLVTNGYISMEPLEELLPFIDALNIDVKAYTEEFYREVVHGRLGPVKATVERALRDAWVEVTYLVIPGLNDSPDQLRELAKWLASIHPSTPLHLSRYFPNYRMSVSATPVSTLLKLKEVAKEYLDFVYVGNAWKRGFADTECPQCGATLLERGALLLERSRLTEEGDCPECGRHLEIVGKVWI